MQVIYIKKSVILFYLEMIFYSVERARYDYTFWEQLKLYLVITVSPSRQNHKQTA